eukprot:3277261-Prymnesium_polylepis.1
MPSALRRFHRLMIDAEMRSDHLASSTDRSHDGPPALDGSCSSTVSNWWMRTPALLRIISEGESTGCAVPPARYRALIRSTTDCAVGFGNGTKLNEGFGNGTAGGGGPGGRGGGGGGSGGRVEGGCKAVVTAGANDAGDGLN